MEATLKVMKSGNSGVIALPAAWRRQRGVKFGDTVVARDLPNGALIVEPAGQSRQQDGKQRLRELRTANSVLAAMTIEEEKAAAHERD